MVRLIGNPPRKLFEWFGVEFQRRREELGLPQSEVCRRTGLSQGCVSAFEMGRRNPTFATILTMAKALDLELHVELRPKAKP